MSLHCIAASKCGQFTLWEDADYQLYWLCVGETSKPIPPHSPFGRVASRLSEQFDLILERHTLGETCEVWLLKFDEHLLLALVPDSDSATIAESVFERWPALLFVTVGSSHMLVARELSLADPSQRLLLARLFQEPSNN
jgi:hypothetical protein